MGCLIGPIVAFSVALNSLSSLHQGLVCLLDEALAAQFIGKQALTDGHLIDKRPHPLIQPSSLSGFPVKPQDTIPGNRRTGFLRAYTHEFIIDETRKGNDLALSQRGRPGPSPCG
ncbi:hypothetical protein C5L14_05140 [Labrys okinawensis]|uniref:Uncharacterized protein n=1 Tax=Labrys okinawensis TaxID=346911 RepID=A0A2S9QH60_9HYPH|nr:hypothetical protein C5L14_05140 [Labrys okinawensis]